MDGPDGGIGIIRTLWDRGETLLQETHQIFKFPTPVQLIGTYENP